MYNITPFPPFDYDIDKSNAGPRWEKWIRKLENLFIGMNLKDDDRKRALLLHYVGDTVFDIYEAEKSSSDDTSYEETKEVLTSYFEPKRNIQMDIFNFRSCKQKVNQSLDDFVTELRQLAKYCDFLNTDEEILSQVIQHCKSSRLRKRALREPDKSLKEILELGRSLEMVDKQAAAIEDEAVNTIKNPRFQKQTTNRKPDMHKSTPTSRNANAKKTTQTPQKPPNACLRCGGKYPHETTCPAMGKICNYCKKPNHFKSVCFKLKRKDQVKLLSQDNPEMTESNDESDDDYCYSIRNVINNIKTTLPEVSLKLDNVKASLLIDTGSTVNVIDEKMYNQLGKPKLQKGTKPSLYPYGNNSPLHVLGQCEIVLETKTQLQCHKFYVTKGNYGSLIGYPTAKALNLVKIIQNINDPTTKYPKLFEGIGKLKDVKVKLHIDEKIPPVAQKPRRTPFHLRDKVEKELQNLIDQDIIEKVNGEPTPWVSPIVAVPKKDSDAVRICIDMREANKAIIRERHQMPTVEELTTDLNGAKIFSKIDLTSGYHQLELEESSRLITTFSTHIGLFRYKRLNFGISSASEIFQEAIRNVIHDIPNAKNISDDIIVFGTTQKEHDDTLDAVFKRLNDKGLTVNKKKCLFSQNKIAFFGLVFSSEGSSPDPKKVSAIKNADKPKDVSQVKSFLGMTNYCGQFIKDYATISEPLRRLTKQNTPWVWSDEQEKAFSQLKELLSDDLVMSYFDPKKEIELIVDASPFGLGAILTQDNKVLSYASRALTEVESRYSQTEREALAIVWACEHFNMYTNGAKHFTVITDHKPLENIWKKPKPTPRLQRWGLRLQPYKFTIKYQPGSSNPSDYLSRHPITTDKTPLQQKIAEEHISFIANTSTPKSMTLEELKDATSKDKTLQQVISFVQTSSWYKMKNLNDPDIDMQELKLFHNIKDELSCYSGNILLRNNLIVIPSSLHNQVIDIAHEGHQGINRTKAFIRSKVWFPRINEKVEAAVKSCLACQSSTYDNNSSKEPLQMSEMPCGPWENLSMDFCGPLPTGDYLFVITDEHSRYPVVEIVRSLTANNIIPILDKVISQFGCPKVIKSDNGPPFNSNAFKNYAQHMGFTHRKITPLWPQANSQAESFNKPMMKSIRAAHVENRNWKQEMHKFLRQYRNTPHSTTKFTPFRLLFGRDPKTKLPEIDNKKEKETNISQQAKQNDKQAKDKAKNYADTRNKAQHKGLKVGDHVLVKNDRRKNKLSTPYDPNPFIIKEKKGSMVTAASNKRNITRNTSFFKRLPSFPPPLIVQEKEKLSTDEIRIESTTTTSTPTIQPQASFPSRPTRARKPPAYLKDFIVY